MVIYHSYVIICGLASNLRVQIFVPHLISLVFPRNNSWKQNKANWDTVTITFLRDWNGLTAKEPSTPNIVSWPILWIVKVKSILANPHDAPMFVVAAMIVDLLETTWVEHIVADIGKGQFLLNWYQRKLIKSSLLITSFFANSHLRVTSPVYPGCITITSLCCLSLYHHIPKQVKSGNLHGSHYTIP